LDSTGRPWSIPNAEGDLLTPSVVLFEGESVVVGKEAVRAAALEPERIAQWVKRDMGSSVCSKAVNGEHLPPEVIQSSILEKLKRDAETKLAARLITRELNGSLYTSYVFPRIRQRHRAPPRSMSARPLG